MSARTPFHSTSVLPGNRPSLRRAICRALAVFGWATPLAAIAAPFPAEIDLSTLDPGNGGDGSVGVFLYGLTGFDYKGWSVAGAGDIDGNGLDDVLVGAPQNGLCDRCATYIAFGRQQLPASIDLFRAPLMSHGADAFIVKSRTSADQGGTSVSSIGDLNGDGFDDFAVGAPFAGPGGEANAGEAYVVFGRATGFAPVFDAEDLLPQNGGDGSEGFILDGVADSDFTGASVSGGCDVNADGIDDLIIGAGHIPQSFPHLGKVHVIFGRESGFPAEFGLARLLPLNGGDGSEGMTIEGIEGGDSAGAAAACTGDPNGDGIDDILIGAPMGADQAGEAYLLLGHAGPFSATFDLSILDPANGGDGSQGTILLNDGYARMGSSVAAAGDVNGDGFADMIIGAPNALANGESSGRAFVVFGRANGFPAEFDLARLLPPNGGDGSEGFALNGVSSGEMAGFTVAGAGDVNADGIADLLIGAPRSAHSGTAYLVFGHSGTFPAEFELASLLTDNGGDGTQGVALIGAQNEGTPGMGVGGAGDVNGDGADDVLVGAPGASPQHDLEHTGYAYVVFGHPNETDSDGDGVADDADNCSALANADQRDTNADGFGNACDADLNNDCTVNFADLGEMKSVFFTSDPDADFDGDGAVNFEDLGVMKADFFLPPGPSGVTNACAESDVRRDRTHNDILFMPGGEEIHDHSITPRH
jgi:glycosylphosphatidylinositol phospholipase D